MRAIILGLLTYYGSFIFLLYLEKVEQYENLEFSECGR